MDKISRGAAYASPTLWVEIDDLRIPCAVPTLDVTQDILERAQKVTGLTNGKITQEGYDYTFALFAALLSCNHNFVEYTPEELKKKNITVSQIIGILTDWVRFIGDLANEKN